MLLRALIVSLATWDHIDGIKDSAVLFSITWFIIIIIIIIIIIKM